MTLKRRPPGDMQPEDQLLQRNKARIEIERGSRLRIDAATKPIEPAGLLVVSS